ncbi:unnamed protein product, partial [Candidula unifasciata]
DEKNQIIHTNIWLQLIWNAANLRWNKDEYGNVSSIRVPKHMVWVPDILMYNSASDNFDQTFATNVVINSDGSCLYVPPGMFKSTCAIDITWFPFDDQKCDLKFGSWTHEGHLLNLTQDKPDGGDITSFIRNGEWMLIGNQLCNLLFASFLIKFFVVYFNLHCVSYSRNLLCSCYLTTDYKMPPTSDALPLIGIYFACIMMMVSVSIVFTVCVLNFHYRSPDTHTMPNWIKNFVCGWLAWVLRMKRPGGTPSRRSLMQRAQVKDFKLGTLEEKSRSLMANVLDMDDDPRMAKGSAASFILKMEDSIGMASSSVRHDITCILREIKKVTAKFRKEEEENDIRNEWRFAAMVMDRLCFIICIIFTLGSTLAVIASAPHLLT